MSDERWVIVDSEDGLDVFGPYDLTELRAAMLEDLIIQVGDEDDTPEAEAAEYRAMETHSLIDEYTGTTGTQIVVISGPTAEWRQEVATNG